MAKKKKPMTVSERVAEHRQRMSESGYAPVSLQLPRTTIAKLDKLAKATGQNRSELIAKLIEES